MSSIFSFPRHRFQACMHCRRPVEFDAEVCPHCDRDLVPTETYVLTGERESDLRVYPETRTTRLGGRKVILVSVVCLIIISVSKILFDGITERNSSEADRSVSVTSEGMQDKMGRSESITAKPADTDESSALQRLEAEKGEGGHGLELMLARSCATVRAWACVREHASKALSYDASDAESQALLEQAIMNSGWKADATPASRP
jgi:hypothetical protein